MDEVVDVELMLSIELHVVVAAVAPELFVVS